MREGDVVRAFMARAAFAEAELRSIEERFAVELLPRSAVSSETTDDVRERFYLQFDEATRTQASQMAIHYEMFYGFENSVRELVREAMTERYGDGWWQNVPNGVRDNVQKNIDRERDHAISARSENPIDYTTFGELSSIIEAQFNECFGDIFNSKKGVSTVLARLNVLRGPIAHCSPLAEDEILRLNLSIRDWFRLME